MKILKNVILLIVLFMLSGCACDRKYIHNHSRYDSEYDFQAFTSRLNTRKGALNSEKYLNESGGKHFKHDNSLNRSKSLKIETYIPFPGKNEKKNSLIAKEYLGESDGKYFDNNFRHRKYREIEIYIPFPRWHRKKRFFTKEYPDEEYLGESDSEYSNYDADFSQSQDRQPQAYQPTSNKHHKPQAYQSSSNKHQKPQAHMPTPSNYPKPQTYIPKPSKHRKP